MRRQPVYLLLDTSGSMSGEPIEAVRRGVKTLLAELRSDPCAIEAVYLSVITFDSTASQVAPLRDLMNFIEPTISAFDATSASDATSLGAALSLLMNCVENEVIKSSPTQKGDFKPIVFLLTDGQPTDQWENAADQVKQKKISNIIAFAAGLGADSSSLKRITDFVIDLNKLPPDSLKPLLCTMFYKA
ncbi:MAG: VWA domain-containing protein [Nitrospirae bacterium]|nr:VWA domain-containing protein [Nitrospirota bacterium]